MANPQEKQNMTMIRSSEKLLSVMEKGDKMKVQLHLSKFKHFGVVQFDKVLSVPTEDRIPAIASTDEGYLRLAAVLTATVKSAMENINLKLPMTEDQIVELAGLIIDQSKEDNLSLEDVMLFLQDLVTGKAGKIYDRMDIPRFFELFEIYRQERHVTLLRIKEEQHSQFKALPSSGRVSEERDSEERNSFHDAMKDYYKDKPGEPEPE
jgi:hypothetical protein